MTLPLCRELEALPDPFSVPLPGGTEIEDIDVMRLLQPALTPLVPLFNVIDTIVAIFNCIKAIPDMLGPPPDPTVLTACLPDLAKKLNKLLNLLPQVALPRTLARALTLAVETLRTARSQLTYLQAQERHIAGSVERARKLGDAGLMAIAQCAKANVAQEAANVGKGLASLGRLLGIIDLFMSLVGGPKVPDLSTMKDKSLDEVIAPLDDLIKLLDGLRRVVPGALAG
jgi:hypothetical protein